MITCIPTSEEEIIEFEDAILLVDPEKSTYDSEDFLAVIPYEGHSIVPFHLKNRILAIIS
jgi:hypothetical protein